MPRSSGGSGQVEPLAALAALVVLGMGLTLFAVAYDNAIPVDRDRNLAHPALSRTVAEAGPGAVVSPGRLRSAARTAAPAGYDLHAALTAGNRSWAAGPRPPPTASRASRVVAVRVGPGRVEPGRLRVAVWR